MNGQHENPEQQALGDKTGLGSLPKLNPMSNQNDNPKMDHNPNGFTYPDLPDADIPLSQREFLTLMFSQSLRDAYEQFFIAMCDHNEHLDEIRLARKEGRITEAKYEADYDKLMTLRMCEVDSFGQLSRSIIAGIEHVLTHCFPVAKSKQVGS